MTSSNSQKDTYSFMRPEQERYKEYAFTALKDRFCGNRDEFEDFYDSLDSSIQDDFLDAAAFYLFLVKQGDWHVKIKDYNKNYASINNCLKLVLLFTLIESLSDKRVRGSTHRCIAFFKCLPKDSQERLLGKIKIKSEDQNESRPMGSIEEMVRFLYKLRSKFVHKLRLFDLGGPDCVAIRVDGKMLSMSSLGIAHLQTLFEEGLLKHFSELNKTRKTQA